MSGEGGRKSDVPLPWMMDVGAFQVPGARLPLPFLSRDYLIRRRRKGDLVDSKRERSRERGGRARIKEKEREEGGQAKKGERGRSLIRRTNRKRDCTSRRLLGLFPRSGSSPSPLHFRKLVRESLLPSPLAHVRSCTFMYART